MGVPVPSTAMVMAAGLGKRMRPLTATRPKPLVEVAGAALIDHVLDRLAAAGVTRAVVNVHYLAASLEAHLKRHTHGLDIAISDERSQLLETGGGLVKALPLIDCDPFVQVNSDNYWVDGPVRCSHAARRSLGQRRDGRAAAARASGTRELPQRARRFPHGRGRTAFAAAHGAGCAVRVDRRADARQAADRRSACRRLFDKHILGSRDRRRGAATASFIRGCGSTSAARPRSQPPKRSLPVADPRAPKVFTIPVYRAFSDALVAGIIAQHGATPLALASGMILVPNNRSARSITDAFVRRSDAGLLLPRIVAIGDAGEAPGSALDLLTNDVPPAVDPLTRALILARLIQQERALARQPVSAAEALRLATELGGTLDELIAEDIDPVRLRALAVAPDLAVHWQASLDLFATVIDRWPEALSELGRIDLPDRRNRLLRALASHFRTVPPRAS